MGTNSRARRTAIEHGSSIEASSSAREGPLEIEGHLLLLGALFERNGSLSLLARHAWRLLIGFARH
jgi:hypothetical protein